MVSRCRKHCPRERRDDRQIYRRCGACLLDPRITRQPGIAWRFGQRLGAFECGRQTLLEIGRGKAVSNRRGTASWKCNLRKRGLRCATRCDHSWRHREYSLSHRKLDEAAEPTLGPFSRFPYHLASAGDRFDRSGRASTKRKISARCACSDWLDCPETVILSPCREALTKPPSMRRPSTSPVSPSPTTRVVGLV